MKVKLFGWINIILAIIILNFNLVLGFDPVVFISALFIIGISTPLLFLEEPKK